MTEEQGITDEQKAALTASLEAVRKSVDRYARVFDDIDHPEHFSEIDLGVIREATRLTRLGSPLPDTAVWHLERIAGKIERDIAKRR